MTLLNYLFLILMEPLINTPLSTSENKEKWSEYYGREYPYVGWWG